MSTYDDVLFRKQFPEFANATTYPETLISAYFDMAQMFISTGGSSAAILRGNQLSLALNQMTAHLLVLGQQAAQGQPGSNQGGFDISASMGEISVSKLAPPAKDSWDWWLCQTSYGQALLALLSALAAGGFSLGGLNERSGFRKAGGVFW
jgi:hypothetical protein